MVLLACGEDVVDVPVDTIPPEVMSTNPGEGLANIPITAFVSATFSENIDARSLDETTFSVDDVEGTVTVTDKTARFTPDTNLTSGTEYTATLSQDVKDIAGNPLGEDYSWSFTTAAISVVATTPTPDEPDAPANTKITARFSEPIDSDSVDPNSFRVDGVPGSAAVDGSTVVFTPDANLNPAATYTATVTTAVTSLAGNSLPQDHAWSFTSGQLEVAQTSPGRGAGAVAVDTPIVVTFDEDVRASTVDENFTVSGVVGAVDVVGKRVTFHPPNGGFATDAVYTVTLTPGIEGLNTGNTLASNYTWDFSTGTVANADAGADRDYTIGETVRLDGSGSSSTTSGPLTYQWTQLSGPTVSFSSTAERPTLSGMPQSVHTLEFRLVVSDANGTSAPDDVRISVLEDRSNKYFVSRNGNLGGSGTRTNPFSTVQRAIDAARTAGRGGDVYVAAGTYGAAIELASDVSIYGGFNPASWVRNVTANETTIRGGRDMLNSSTAVFGRQVAGIVLDGLNIESTGVTTAGHSSIAVYLYDSQGMVISNCNVRAGAGAAGTNGNSGTQPSRADSGDNGVQGGECNIDCICSGGSCSGYGAGGSGTNPGGRGGESGSGFGCDGKAGVGPGGGAPGAGGPTGPPYVAGTDGEPGDDGIPGGGGSGGSSFGSLEPVFLGHVYKPAPGGPGTQGSHGSGGGGGGGGSGNGFTCGGGGGGGGAGGKPGTVGFGGGGGGGSFGIYLVAQSEVSIVDTSVATVGGGPGGAGGSGGAGGNGGFGRTGGNGVSNGGKGGRGGDGGQGGRGGHGGGGGGGPSIGILEDGSSNSSRERVAYSLGPGGGRGGSQGNQGALGQRVNHKKLSQ